MVHLTNGREEFVHESQCMGMTLYVTRWKPGWICLEHPLLHFLPQFLYEGAVVPPIAGEVALIWREGEWACEFHRGHGQTGRLDVYRNDRLFVREATMSAPVALEQAEAFRQRLLRIGTPLVPFVDDSS